MAKGLDTKFSYTLQCYSFRPEKEVGPHLFISIYCPTGPPFPRTASKASSEQLGKAKLIVRLVSDLILPYPDWKRELAWRTADFTKQISFLLAGKASFLSEAQNDLRELTIPVTLLRPLAETLPKMLWPGLTHIIGLSAIQRVVYDPCNFNIVNPSVDISVYLLFTCWYLASMQQASEWSHVSSM